MKLPEKNLKYIDNAELQETYVDSIAETSWYDGMAMRIDLCVTRLDKPTPQRQPTGRQYPVARLVLSNDAITDLYNRLNNIVKALEADGKIKREPVIGPLTGTKQ